MREHIACPSCGRRLLLPDEYQGQRVRCPACATEFVGDAAHPAAPARPAAPAADPSESALPWAHAVERDTPPAASARKPIQGGEEPLPDRSARERPPQRRIYRRPENRIPTPIKILAIIAVVIVGGVLLYVFSSSPAKPRRPAFNPQEDAQRRRDLLEAFKNQAPLGPDEIAREIKPLFDGLGAAYRARDAARLVDRFDVDRIIDEIMAMDLFPGLRNRRPLVEGVREGMGRALAQQAPLMEFDDTEIRHLRKLEGNEAVVIVRHRGRDGVFLKIRYWVSKRSGSWRIYDMEDLDVGMRMSAAMGVVAEAGFANAQGIARAVQGLQQALVAAAVQHDVDTAERRLAEVAGIALPKKLDALRFLVKGMLASQRNQFEQALAEFNQAHVCNPDMPGVDLLKAIAFNRLNQSDKALACIEKYRALLGEDFLVCDELGVALAGVGRNDEACAAFRKALDYDPKNSDTFLDLLRHLRPGAKRDDLAARFVKLDNPHGHFDACADECKRVRDADTLEQIALAMRRLDPQHDGIDYCLALAKVMKGKASEAGPLFKAALAKQADPARAREYAEGFVRELAIDGKAAMAYELLPDRREALRILGGQLRSQPAELSRLLRLHRKNDPADPALPFHEAELLLQAGDYAAADKQFAAAVAKQPAFAGVDQFRISRVQAAYHTGQALRAYADIPPKTETFRQLANLSYQDRDAAQLAKLLDAHAKDDAQNEDVIRSRYRVKLLRNDVAGAIAAFKKEVKTIFPDDRRKSAIADFRFDLADEGKIVEAYEAFPDDEAFRSLAEETLGHGNREELPRLIEAHRRRRPDDMWLAFYTGERLIEEGAWAKAATVLGEAMRKAPPGERDRFRGNYVFAMLKAGKSLEVYNEAEARKETFVQIASSLARDGKGPELEALIAAHRPHAGADPELLYYDARAHALAKKVDDACRLMNDLYPKVANDWQRKQYVREFVLDMASQGNGLEAYRRAPEPLTAFEALAQEFVIAKKEKDLAKLLAAHAEKCPRDPLRNLYTGEWHLLRGKVGEADAALSAGVAAATPAEGLRYRTALTRTRVDRGKVAETYVELGPGTRSFEDLAFACLDRKNGKALRTLIAAHREVFPDDPSLTVWEIDAQALDKDYEGVVKTLKAHRSWLAPTFRDSWKLQGHLVRGLIQLKRTDEALREVQGWQERRHGNRMLLVLAHAAAGDVKQAIAAADKQRSDTFFLEDCYRDPDLGPILRSDSFAEFRARFPEPKLRRPFERDLRDPLD